MWGKSTNLLLQDLSVDWICSILEPYTRTLVQCLKPHEPLQTWCFCFQVSNWCLANYILLNSPKPQSSLGVILKVIWSMLNFLRYSNQYQWRWLIKDDRTLLSDACLQRYFNRLFQTLRLHVYSCIQHFLSEWLYQRKIIIYPVTYIFCYGCQTLIFSPETWCAYSGFVSTISTLSSRGKFCCAISDVLGGLGPFDQAKQVVSCPK